MVRGNPIFRNKHQGVQNSPQMPFVHFGGEEKRKARRRKRKRDK